VAMGSLTVFSSRRDKNKFRYKPFPPPWEGLSFHLNLKKNPRFTNIGSRFSGLPV
jgi:hypothetical protein